MGIHPDATEKFTLHRDRLARTAWSARMQLIKQHIAQVHTHRLLHMGQLSDIYGSWDKNDLEFSIRGVSYL